MRTLPNLLLTLLAAGLWQCKTPDAAPSPYESGVYIVNEGNYSQNNGSLSYLPATGTTTVQTNIFEAANPTLKMNGLLNDYTEADGKGLLVIDNTAAGQDRIEIVETGTFKSRATLKAPDIENPRRVVYAAPNKVYVSCWDVSGDFKAGTFYKDPGYVAVVDINAGKVTQKIAAVKGAESMVTVGKEVFVGSAPYSGGKTMLIIDTDTDKLKADAITFSAEPRPLGVDALSRLWVLAGAELARINITSRQIEQKITLPDMPADVAFSRDKRYLFYSVNGQTYRLGINETAAPAAAFIPRAFAALGVDPPTGRLYGSQHPALYSQANYVIRYDEGGRFIDSLKAEIAPTRFYFR